MVNYLAEIVEDEDKGKTTLTEWLVNNTKESGADFTVPVNGLHLWYVDYLSEYCWEKKSGIAEKHENEWLRNRLVPSRLVELAVWIVVERIRGAILGNDLT